MTELMVRVAMLELRTKLWCAAIGLLGGGILTGVVNLFLAARVVHP